MKNRTRRQPPKAGGQAEPAVCDQLVRNEVTASARGIDEKGKRFHLNLEMAIYPDHDDSNVLVTPWREGEPTRQGVNGQDIQLRLVEMEAFSIGLTELVRIAKSRGFLPPGGEGI